MVIREVEECVGVGDLPCKASAGQLVERDEAHSAAWICCFRADAFPEGVVEVVGVVQGEHADGESGNAVR